ncbi:MAG: OmpA family protein [Saprospiraceae bacterium]|nr:OmpA family protein [Saprospiraceae bacterium]MCF8252915.1 OmpA family protein [Saprospiraceae bacterium]MCF8313783.1 OmpA family protein [Saprospiraceae bacterium]MCF8442489.1 OmpA family protein [Saprospiraceae bacterium]
MKNTVHFIFLLLPLFTVAQDGNLVLNPGFEKLLPNAPFKPCSYIQNGESFDKSVANWTTYRTMTPDLIDWQSDAYGECFFPKPHSGDRAVGIITYHPRFDTGRYDDFHELVQGELRAPLTVGKKYRVELYVNQSDATALNHLMMLYGEKRDIRPTAAGNLGVLFLYNKNDYLKGNEQPQFLVTEPIVTGKDEWKLISGTFTADRAYLAFMVGNFFTDENTLTTLENPVEIDSSNLKLDRPIERIKRIAYYLIDDIRIVPADAPPPNPDISTALKTKKTYTFQNVNFKTGQWDLLPPALPELDGLAAFLKENPKVKVEIGGHTDDVGNDDDNQLLSQNRAESVYNYLISKGIAPERLKYKGYGESQPIAPNTSSASRLQNRRVACKVI